MFEHDLLPVKLLNRVDSPNGRIYEVPTENGIERYPSVTTLLGKYYDDGGIECWRKAVGAEVADKVSAQARNRGTAMHAIYEDYLMNRPLDTRKIMPINLLDFRKAQSILDNNITKVYGVEMPLYSSEMKLAGTADALVDWRGTRSILDFKTSKKVKKINEIQNYLTQTTIYSMMIKYLYGLSVPQVVILMTVDHDNPLIFIEKTETHIPAVNKVLEFNLL